jgi:uncharacterized protein
MISNMNWHVVRLNDVVPMPWRNGGGTTRELLAWPDSVAWQWRASVAEVVQSGPFSSFVGVQRWFAVLEGDGVCLTVDGCLHRLGKRGEALAFDGASETTCELRGGATQDFNLMAQGGTSARLLRVVEAFQMVTKTPKIIAAYANKENAKVQIGNEIHALSPHSFGWAHVDANTPVHVKAKDALLMEIDV